MKQKGLVCGPRKRITIFEHEDRRQEEDEDCEQRLKESGMSELLSHAMNK